MSATAAGITLVIAITMSDGSGAILMDHKTGTLPVFDTMEACTLVLNDIKPKVLADARVNQAETIMECRTEAKPAS